MIDVRPDQEAELALARIERYVRFLRDQCARALASFLDEPTEGLASSPLSAADFAQHRAHWQSLLPADPAAHAALPGLIAERHDASRPSGRTGAAAEELLPHLEWVTLPAGETLVRQGDPSDSIYLVASGRLVVLRRDADGQSRTVGQIGRGDMVGEMGVIACEPRSATVVAARDSALVRLPKAAFDRLVESHPRATMRVASALVRRLQDRGTPGGKSPSSPGTIALVPSGPGAPLAHVARGLASALGRYGSVLLLDSPGVDRALQPGAAQARPNSAEHAAVAAWLDEQEARHGVVLYVADADDTEWTRQCGRQADRILLIGCADDDPRPGPAEHAIAATEREHLARRLDLVLVRDVGRAPRGTAAWLEARSVRRHFHVERGCEADIARLARHLTGRAIGLVLGSGAARGFAHIGVLRALAEANVPVDAIGGTSAGAIVAAQHALGWGHETMLRANHDLARLGRGLMDWTIPIVSFFAGRKLSGALEEMFGDARIEDLPAPFFCTSANLTRAQIVVHERGPLGRAIQASCAVPGFYPPVLEGGDMLVDGGILSTVPHEAMREFCDGGRVIAVNVMAEVDLQNAAGLEGFSAARYLWQRWRPFARTRPAVPGLLSIMYRAAELGSVRARANAVDQPDLLLEPPITHLSSVDGTPFDQFVEAGYRHTREMLARWEGGPKL